MIISIFTDGSYNPQSRLGVGGFLVFENLNENFLIKGQIDQIKSSISFLEFDNTSSTKLEIETAICSLNTIKEQYKSNLKEVIINIYTDSQTLTRLFDRREKLEKNNFVGKSSGKTNKNKELYISLFNLSEELNINFIKVKGHNKNYFDNIFTHIFAILDRELRKKLRNT